MPRYFFDTDDGDLGLVDHEGDVLEKDASARAVALYKLCDMLGEHIHARGPQTFTAAVRNEKGTLVFAAAVALTTSA